MTKRRSTNFPVGRLLLRCAGCEVRRPTGRFAGHLTGRSFFSISPWANLDAHFTRHPVNHLHRQPDDVGVTTFDPFDEERREALNRVSPGLVKWLPARHVP